MKNTCALVAAGQLFTPAKNLQEFLKRVDYIIAADKGAEYVLEMSLWPNEVHGDFDSINPSSLNTLKRKGVQLVRYPLEKDQTDLEIIADVALTKGFSTIYLIGGWGGRIDHSLASLFVLFKIKRKGKRAIMVTPFAEVEILKGESSLKGEIGDTLSLLAWTGSACVDLSGCYYEGKNIVLKPWETLGISNVFLEKTVSVNVKKGYVLAVRGLKSNGINNEPKEYSNDKF